MREQKLCRVSWQQGGWVVIVPISKRIRSLLKSGFHGNFAVIEDIEDIEGDDMQNWTPEQVEQLNRLQRGELCGHPYTCPNRSIMPHHDNGREIGCLLATKDGWVCPDCGYTEGVPLDLAQETISATDMFALGA
ncbi:MAG: hypothetical protein ACYDB0_07030 [Acidithiobacillus sp.]